MNILLADGSVRYMPFTIDPLVFNRLGLRDDGSIIPDDF
jgi:hypothetical protein